MKPASHIRQLLESIERIDEATVTPEKVTAALKPSKGKNLKDAASRLGISIEHLVRWLNLHTDKLGPESYRWIDKSNGNTTWGVGMHRRRDGDEPAFIPRQGTLYSKLWYKNGEISQNEDGPVISDEREEKIIPRIAFYKNEDGRREYEIMIFFPEDAANRYDICCLANDGYSEVPTDFFQRCTYPVNPINLKKASLKYIDVISMIDRARYMHDSPVKIKILQKDTHEMRQKRWSQ